MCSRKHWGMSANITEPPQNPESPDRIRWGLIALVTTFGLIVTSAPFFLIWWQGEAFGDWQGLLASTLTNVGTAILLVAVFWFLERWFTAQIKSDVRKTARATVVEETRGLAATQRDLSERLDDIQQRLEDRVSRARQEEDEVLRRLDQAVSFDSTYAALQLAENLGAIWHHELTIPAGNGDPALPRFTFRLSSSSTNPPHRLRNNEELTPLVEVEWTAPEHATRPLVVHWASGRAPDAVLAEMRQMLIATGFAAQAVHVDVSLFSNLRVALGAAVAGRRKDADAWLNGALTEWVNSDWAVTSYGLEHRGPHGMRSEDFPIHWNGRSNVESIRWKTPAPPEGVDKTLWDFLIASARRRHRPGASLPA